MVQRIGVVGAEEEGLRSRSVDGWEVDFEKMITYFLISVFHPLARRVWLERRAIAIRLDCVEAEVVLKPELEEGGGVLVFGNVINGSKLEL